MRKILSDGCCRSLCCSLVMFAQDKGGPPKGGKGGKGWPAEESQSSHSRELYGQHADVFVPALGLADKGGCNFCHVADDRSSDDEAEEKVMARMMIGMVNDINGKFPDGKVHVTCFTCHRGSTEPLTAPPAAN